MIRDSLYLLFAPGERAPVTGGSKLPETPGHAMLVGDAASDPDASGWRGNAAVIEWKASTPSIRVRSSVSGFPPLFLVDTDGWRGVTTSPALLRDVPGFPAYADPRGLLDLCTIGFPVDNRTLLRGISLIPAGAELMVRPESTDVLERWRPEDHQFTDLEEYTEAQRARFAEVMRALPARDSLLSLSGGLDTRGILAGLVQREVTVRCFTVSGRRPTLDAVRARDLCEAYGLPHSVVVLGDEFQSELWSLATRAASLSGGLTSLGAAPQVYCYDQMDVGQDAQAVLSGFLGNQVGRGATEGLTARPTDLRILHDDLLPRTARPGGDPWYTRGMDRSGRFSRRFLIQEENLFASLGPYLVGHGRATQRSPYTDAILLSNAIRIPSSEPEQSGSRWRLDPRIPELGRRFFGTGETSFQRRFITDVGGPVATQSVNYGWTPSGRLSPRGLATGFRAFTEDVLHAASRRSRLAEAVFNASRLRGFSTHLEPEEWVKQVRDPLLDELASEAIRSSGILNPDSARDLAESYFSGGAARPDTVIALMDVVLAQKTLGLRIA